MDLGSLKLRFEGDARDLDRTLTGIGIKANLAAKAIETGFQAATKALVDFGKGSIQAFDKQTKAEASLLTALKGREDVQQRLIKQAGEIQNATLFGDEDVIQQQAFLSSLQLTEDQINKVIKAATDLSSGTGLTLESSVKNLAKTYSGLTGELGESIPQLRTLSVAQLKAGEAIEVVQKAFEGQATAAAKADVTLGQVRNKIGDVQEVIGGTLGPAIQQVGEGLLSLFTEIEQNVGSQKIRDAAIDTGAFIKAALISASTETQLAYNRLKEGVLGVFEFIAEQGVNLSQGPFSRFLFSDEERAKDLVTLARIRGDLDETKAKIEELTRTGKTFKEVYEDTQFDASLLKLDSRLQALGTSASSTVRPFNDSGDSVKGLGDKAKSAGDELTRALAVYQKFLELQRGVTIEDDIGRFGVADLSGEARAAEFRASGPPVFDTTASLSGNVKEIDDETLAIQRKADELERVNKILAIGQEINSAFTASFAQSTKEGVDGAKALGRAFIAASKATIGALIREGVVASVTQTLKTSKVPFPFNVVLAGLAGAAAQALFQNILGKIPAFGDGGVVDKPTLALIGEKGPEAIVPLRGGRGNQTITARVTGINYGNDWYWMNQKSNQLGNLIHGGG